MILLLFIWSTEVASSFRQNVICVCDKEMANMFSHSTNYASVERKKLHIELEVGKIEIVKRTNAKARVYTQMDELTINMFSFVL